MKKKQSSKPQGATAGSKGKGAKGPKGPKSVKSAKSAPARGALAKAGPAKASKPAADKPAAKKAAAAKPAAAKPAAKPPVKSAPTKPSPVKPRSRDPEDDDLPRGSLLAALAGLGGKRDQGADDFEAEDGADRDRSGDKDKDKDDKAGLDKVMASLTQIFGGKDFMSDAELDALLDSKMASGEIPPSAALDPLDEAQSLIYEAWNSEDIVKVELAHRALDLCPDCADAYVILAEEDADSRQAALALYRKGVEAGKRSLDPALFVKSVGKFWDIMETRPYMRARLGLAECLWDLGKKEDALGHLRELMRLNPADDQGVRYILLQCLLESGADEELGALLERYGKDTSPEIRFTRSLWLFRRHGPGAAADASLKEAIRANPHVPAFLLKRKKLPRQAPKAAREGSEEEAEAYAGGALDPWHKTLGALEWLAGHVPA